MTKNYDWSDEDRLEGDPTLVEIATCCDEIRSNPMRFFRKHKQKHRPRTVCRKEAINTSDISGLTYEDLVYLDRSKEFPLLWHEDI